jgi:hypothetical protein
VGGKGWTSMYIKGWFKSVFPLFLYWILPQLKFLVPMVDFVPSPPPFPPHSVISSRSQWSCGLRSGSPLLTCWDCRFESHRGHGCLSLVSVVLCQVVVSATRGFPPSVVCLSVISKPERRESVSPLGLLNHGRNILLAKLGQWVDTYLYFKHMTLLYALG